jgi:hypothetical protein
MTKEILLAAMEADADLKRAVEYQANKNEMSIDQLLSDERNVDELSQRYIWNIRKNLRKV